jgi:hypothetical protein
MITSSHCFTQFNANLDEVCKATSVIFPSNSRSGRAVGTCTKVLDHSHVVASNYDAADYLIFQLQLPLSERGHLSVSRGGMPAGASFEVAKVDQLGSEKGIVVMQRCTSLLGTIFRPGAVTADDPVQVLRNCQINSGNNGAPLTDANGNFAGLINAAADPASLTIPAESADPNGLIAVINAAQPSYATNASCILYPIGGAAPHDPNHCEVLLQEPMPAAKVDETVAKTMMNAEISNEETQNPVVKQFGYRMFSNASSALATTSYVPVCFEKPRTWLSKYKGGFLGLSYKTLAIERLRIYNWKVDVNVTPGLTYQLEAIDLDPYDVTVNFDPLTLHDTGSSPVTYRGGPTLTGVTTDWETSTWATCP